MYACRITHERNRLLLRPTFGTLSAFWLFLAVPISCLSLGALIWLNVDAVRIAEVPAFAFPLFFSVATLAVACLLISVARSPLPLILDAEKGLRHGRQWLPLEEMTSLRVESDAEDELTEQYHLWVHLQNGHRVELKRALWIVESDHERICTLGDQVATFLNLPLIDCTVLPTRIPQHTFRLCHGTTTGGHQA